MIMFRRIVATPRRWTFDNPDIAEIVHRYADGGRGWVDPFAGHSAFAEWTNDLDPTAPAKFHLLAADFVRDVIPESIDGVLWDPPYSYRQISDCYKGVGREVHMNDTNASFYSSVRLPLIPKVRRGGHVISCGWTSAGFGENNGFEVIEGLLVAHPHQHRNDTIVTVEKKVR